MDKHPSHVKHTRKGDDLLPIPPEYQMYMDERMTKKKKKVLVKSRPRSESPFRSPAFEVPTSDTTGRFLPAPSENQKNSTNQYGHPTEPRWNTHNSHDASMNYQPSSPKSKKTTKGDPNESLDYHPNRILTVDSTYETNKSSKNDTLYPELAKQNYHPGYSQPMYTNFKQNPNKPVRTEPTQINLDENPSLICRAVNYEGEPVKVNDEVIDDKLILSCRPRTFYGLGGYFKKPHLDTSDRGPYYPSAPPQVNIVEDININRRTDIDIRPQYGGNVDDRDYPKAPLQRSDAMNMGSLGLGDNGLEQTSLQAQTAKYEEQYRIMQCKKYMCNFKKFLWALFLINTLLLVTGVTILFLCMYHFIHHDYMNTVLMYTGFVTWIWVALALSMIIIAVALFGILTAVTRRKQIIRCWIICAIVTIVLILVFLLVYWLMHTDMIELKEKSMQNTFHRYRCSRMVRHAWDTLQEQHKCCGVDNRAEWKYIPPSCCQAEEKYEKLKCVNHFITYERAYKNACRALLEEYFTTLFSLLTVLLVLAIILLFLGIIVAWRLLKMYKIIRLCRDTYSITS